MPKQFPERLKGAATSRASMKARNSKSGPIPKPITLPSLESLKVLLEDKLKERKK